MGVVEVAVIGVFAMLGVLVFVELFWPTRSFERVSGWRLKCVAFMVVIAVG